MSFLQLFFSFNGRIGRQTFWSQCMLPILIILFVIFYIEINMITNSVSTSYGIYDCFLVLKLFFMWPLLAIHAKRWHDLDKSGWWILTFFIPILNIWHMLTNWFSTGSEGNNRFGPDTLKK